MLLHVVRCLFFVEVLERLGFASIQGEGRASSCQIWASPQRPATSESSETAETAPNQLLWVVEFGFACLSDSLVLRLEDTSSCIHRCIAKCMPSALLVIRFEWHRLLILKIYVLVVFFSPSWLLLATTETFHMSERVQRAEFERVRKTRQHNHL